jgi:hypothetical protein
MGKNDDEYEAFVAHPRYGQGPRVTGLNPTTKYHYEPGEHIVKLHWHSGRDRRIPNTAIEADISKQSFTTFPVTHYFDAKRTCHGCKRPFLFFAEEQQYWYEELGFPLDADCVRCVPCRKEEQGIARKRERYEELFHVASPTEEELLEMADCCVCLMEASLFSVRQHERVRMLLHRVPDRPRHAKRKEKLLARVRKLEEG